MGAEAETEDKREQRRPQGTAAGLAGGATDDEQMRVVALTRTADALRRSEEQKQAFRQRHAAEGGGHLREAAAARAVEALAVDTSCGGALLARKGVTRRDADGGGGGGGGGGGAAAGAADGAAGGAPAEPESPLWARLRESLSPMLEGLSPKDSSPKEPPPAEAEPPAQLSAQSTQRAVEKGQEEGRVQGREQEKAVAEGAPSSVKGIRSRTENQPAGKGKGDTAKAKAGHAGVGESRANALLPPVAPGHPDNGNKEPGVLPSATAAASLVISELTERMAEKAALMTLSAKVQRGSLAMQAAPPAPPVRFAFACVDCHKPVPFLTHLHSGRDRHHRTTN
jgi:hypothetical protein